MSAVNRFRSLLKGRCPPCGYRFEKEPGFSVGAMYASYALTLAESLTVYLLIRYFTTAPALLVLIIVSVVGSLLADSHQFQVLQDSVDVRVHPKRETT
mgnify:CR=1 FL=1